MAKPVVGLLFGGKSSEHEVSLTSGASVLKAIAQDCFTVLPILIARTGRWLLVEDPSFLLDNPNDFIREKDCPLNDLVPVVLDYADSGELISLAEGRRQRWKIDVALPILHGPGGEDGSIQGLMQLAGIPCAGAGILGSAVGLDKVIAKTIAHYHNIPIVPFCAFIYSQWQAEADGIVAEAVQRFDFPMFVKPANCGSSVGITKVRDVEALKKAVEYAAGFDRKILIEKGIDARELECAVLGNDFPSPSVVGEIRPAHEFYDYEAKYFAGSKLIIPADISPKLSERLQEMSVAVYRALDCAGMGRVDFLMEKKRSEEVYFNEINTLPGFTQQSMYPKLWEATGLPYRELITRLIELALERRGGPR